MASVAQTAGKGKKKRVLREGRIVAADEYDGLQVDAKAELIRQLVPLGLMHVCEMLQDEVTRHEWRRAAVIVVVVDSQIVDSVPVVTEHLECCGRFDQVAGICNESL